jgi:hypothetical protein
VLGGAAERVRESRGQLVAHREPVAVPLPRAVDAGSEHDDQSAGRDRVRDRVQLVVGDGDGRPLPLELQAGVVPQDLGEELLQRPSGLDPQLVHEHASTVVVRLQRLRLASRAVERQHHLATELLAEGLLGNERLELADQLGVATALEVGVDSLFEGRQPQLLEPSDLTLRERLEREVRQRRASPEPKRGAEGACPLLTREQPGLGHESLEPAEVRLLR